MKKAIMFFISIVSLVLMLSIVSLATNYTFKLKDVNGNYITGATLEIRGLNGTGNFVMTNGYITVNMGAGNEIGYNIRSGSYVTYISSLVTLPTESCTYTHTVGPASTFSAFGYTAPFSSYESNITSNCGWRCYTYNGTLYFNKHEGLDIQKAVNTPIKSISASKSDGNVNFYSGYDSVSGNYVWIKSPNNFWILYAHMNVLTDFTGVTSIAQGDTIGVVGTTGNSTGYHLHNGIYNNSKSAFFDPLMFY